MDRRIPIVTRSGTAVCGRADIPADFAYAAAKALDEQQRLFASSNKTFSHNRYTVARTFSVPPHPGAERYYRERGYLE